MPPPALLPSVFRLIPISLVADMPHHSSANYVRIILLHPPSSFLPSFLSAGDCGAKRGLPQVFSPRPHLATSNFGHLVYTTIVTRGGITAVYWSSPLKSAPACDGGGREHLLNSIAEPRQTASEQMKKTGLIYRLESYLYFKSGEEGGRHSLDM